ncbi:MAG: aldehyde dehydrogenase family protein [Bauldia sp.]
MLKGMTFERNLIDGEWVPSATGETLPMISPSDGAEFARIARGTTVDVDRAVKAARRAFEGVWGRTPAVERGRLLSRLGLLILDHAEELVALEARDTGKPLKQARNDIQAAARYFEFYGGAADKIHGETIPFLSGYQVMILREPRGITAHIIPWNYPAQMFGRTLAATLAAGNAAVLKPAEEACLSCLRMAELAMDVGFPPGALNVVTGLGEEAGAALAAHAGIDFISFTGSPEVGTLVQRAAAATHIACVLELGGKSPQIVFDDADQVGAAEATVNAIIQNAGQTCSAGSRVLIQRSIYEAFLGELAQRFNRLKVGPHDLDLDCGPLISARQKQRVETYLKTAAADHIAAAAAGTIDKRASPGGFFVRPTLLTLVPETHAIAREEVFGPVLSAIAFDDEQDGLRIANGTDFGLVAGVWTENGGRQMRVAKGVRAGQVFVNGYGAGGGIELPFGGFKRSGHGREKGLEALRELTVAKTVVFNHG